MQTAAVDTIAKVRGMKPGTIVVSNYSSGGQEAHRVYLRTKQGLEILVCKDGVSGFVDCPFDSLEFYPFESFKVLFDPSAFALPPVPVGRSLYGNE